MAKCDVFFQLRHFYNLISDFTFIIRQEIRFALLYVLVNGLAIELIRYPGLLLCYILELISSQKPDIWPNTDTGYWSIIRPAGY